MSGRAGAADTKPIAATGSFDDAAVGDALIPQLIEGLANE